MTDDIANFTVVGLPANTGDSDNSFVVNDINNGDRVAAGGDFLEFDPPVANFTIKGINPRVSGSDPTIFPTFLTFDQPVVSFTMTSLGILVATTSTTLELLTTTTGVSSFDCGDATQDGKVNTADALRALQAAVGILQCDLSLCDASGNGVLTADDALRILRFAVGFDVDMLCPMF